MLVLGLKHRSCTHVPDLGYHNSRNRAHSLVLSFNLCGVAIVLVPTDGSAPTIARELVVARRRKLTLNTALLPRARI